MSPQAKFQAHWREPRSAGPRPAANPRTSHRLRALLRSWLRSSDPGDLQRAFEKPLHVLKEEPDKPEPPHLLQGEGRGQGAGAGGGEG